MTCPALLMRNTTDDPTWTTSLIYRDHVSWFPGGAYVVQELFRQHYAERRLASASRTFRDLPNRKVFFDEISTMKPEGWTPGAMDAIATASADGRRTVIKAVNYTAGPQPLLAKITGARAPEKAVATLHTITVPAKATASVEHPNVIAPVTGCTTGKWWASLNHAARERVDRRSQKSSKRPLRIEQRRAMMALAPRNGRI